MAPGAKEVIDAQPESLREILLGSTPEASSKLNSLCIRRFIQLAGNDYSPPDLKDLAQMTLAFDLMLVQEAGLINRSATFESRSALQDALFNEAEAKARERAARYAQYRPLAQKFAALLQNASIGAWK